MPEIGDRRRFSFKHGFSLFESESFRKEDKKYIKKFLAQASLVELLSDCAPIIGVGGFFAGYFIAADTTTNDWKLLAIWAGIAGSTAYLASHISAKLGCLSSRDKRVWK